MADAIETAQWLSQFVPVFVGPLTPDGNPSGWNGWNESPVDPTVMARWQPGLGVGVVCGHLFDVLDVDPRNGGDETLAGLREAGLLPRVFGEARTPQGGWHLFIAPLGVGSRDDIFPGIDLKGGKSDGSSRGFVFIAPTVRKGGTYCWTTLPDFDALAEGDDSGIPMAEHVRSLKAGQGWAAEPAERYVGPPPTGREAKYLAGLLEGLSGDLGAATEGQRNMTLYHVALKAGSFAAGAGLDQDHARQVLCGKARELGLAPDEIARSWKSGFDNGWKNPRPVPPEPSNGEGGSSSSSTSHQDTAPSPPTLAPEAYYGLLGEIVEVAKPTTEGDPAGILASLLCGVGALLNRTPHLQISSTRHPLLVWPLLFGRTGSGRKGEATNTAELFLRAASVDFAKLRTSGLSSGEGLIERIRDLQEVKVGKLTETVGTDDKRLFVVEPEFASVMARAKREGSTLAAVLREAWDGRALSVLNRSPIRAEHSHVGIVGHVTPREFKMKLAEAELAGGLYNRFLPIWCERGPLLPVPPTLKARTISDWGEKLGTAMKSAPQHTLPIKLDDPQAIEYWSDLYSRYSETDDSDEAWLEFSRRAAPYCLRIAAIYTLLDDGRTEIGIAHLEAASALVDFALATARYVLGNQSRDPRLDRIRRALDVSNSGLTRTEVSELFGRNVTADVLDALLAQVLADGHYEQVTEPAEGGVGRDRVVYRRTKETN